MSRLLRHAIVLSIAMAVSTSVTRSARAQGQADFFSDAVMQDVQIRINSGDWQTLKAHPELDDYYPADVVWNGIVVRNVGIRSRGSGSRNGIKPGLRVDINRFTSDQSFLGLDAFILDNAFTDPSLVRETVSMKLFARLQLPAPREAHTRLFVNDQYVGTYVIVEEINREFIERLFGAEEASGKSGGFLFEYKWVFPYNFEDLGTDLTAYADLFEPQTREDDPVSDLYAPIEEMIRVINGASDQDFAATAGRYVDLPALMKYVAVESFLDESDGLAGDWATNNFYLYRFRDGRPSQFIPWDKDHAFQNPSTPVTARLSRNVLIRRALAVPQLKQVFIDALKACATISTEPAANDPRGWLEREVGRQAGNIGAAVRADPVLPVTVEQFQAEVDFLRQFAETRPAFVACEAVQMTDPFVVPGNCSQR